MQKMTGTLLMIGGVLLFVIGLIVFKAQKSKEVSRIDMDKIVEMAAADGVLTNNERKLIDQTAYEQGVDGAKIIADIEQQLANSEADSETEVIDYRKKNGNDFEAFVLEHFDQNYYKLKEWAGDKYSNGRYADSTLHPDLLLELSLKGEKFPLAVECKWRKQLYKGQVSWASEAQFKRYRQFEAESQIPVFIAIGLGGKGASPEQLFVLPLKWIKSHSLSMSYLEKHSKKLESPFFYMVEKGILK